MTRSASDLRVIDRYSGEQFLFESFLRLHTDFIQKFYDDPGAELTRYKFKLGFFSLTILHENPTASPGDVLSPGVSASDRLKSISETFFNKIGLVSTTGYSVDLTEQRHKFSEACPHDHLG